MRQVLSGWWRRRIQFFSVLCFFCGKSESFIRYDALSGDGNGDVIMYFTVPRDCQSVIISCPEFENGSTYSIYGGDSLLTSFTISSTITVIGSESPIRDPGGMPGGNRPGPDTPGFGGR